MYGGDWHVSELAGTYPQWVEIVDWVTEGASLEEKRKLFRDNAISFYRLDNPR
jgi:L-fuconolactonase